jgi:integrase/recombinase XerD
MILIAPHITAFLRERLPVERMASPNTCDTYAYAFQLLFEFASKKLKVSPSGLCLEQLDAPLILAFLAHLENERRCCPSSRSARLTALKSFFDISNTGFHLLSNRYAPSWQFRSRKLSHDLSAIHPLRR